MSTNHLATQIDFIEELRMRRWARENYVPAAERNRAWHPIILDEMSRKDHDVRGVEGKTTPTLSV